MEKHAARNLSIDALKGVATVSVVFLHLPYTGQTQSWNTWHLLSILARFAVPCFFLISGYFFFISYHQTERPALLLRKTAVRIITIFFFWAVAYSVIPPFIGGGSALQHLNAIARFPHSFVLTGFVYHLWFLSSLLQGILIAWIVLRFQQFLFGFLFGLALFIFAWIVDTLTFAHLIPSIGFDMKNGPFLSTLFVLLGCLMAKKKWIISSRKGFLLIIMGASLCILEINLLHSFFDTPIESRSLMIGTIPFTIGLMSLAKAGNLPTGFLAVLGRYSLGIYVIHPWVIEVISSMRIRFQETPMFLMVALVVLLSLLLTWPLTKISYVRRIVI